jgi:hypothetical protein
MTTISNFIGTVAGLVVGSLAGTGLLLMAASVRRWGDRRAPQNKPEQIPGQCWNQARAGAEMKARGNGNRDQIAPILSSSIGVHAAFSINPNFGSVNQTKAK